MKNSLIVALERKPELGKRDGIQYTGGGGGFQLAHKQFIFSNEIDSWVYWAEIWVGGKMGGGSP